MKRESGGFLMFGIYGESSTNKRHHSCKENISLDAADFLLLCSTLVGGADSANEVENSQQMKFGEKKSDIMGDEKKE